MHEPHTADFEGLAHVAAADLLIAVGALFNARGWVPATGGNFSVRLPDGQILITASGVHKGELSRGDFLRVDAHGQPLEIGRKASFETQLHLEAYRHDPAAGCVLHVHSVANTVLSRRGQSISLENYELLKLLPGITEPALAVEIPVFENDQNIARLSRQIEAYRQTHSAFAAYLIAGHGLYTWGADVAGTRHRVEALEFMFSCELQEVKTK